jgi:ketosteroid isomerase-like protein
MAQENVEIVRRAFEILQEGARRGDLGAAFDECVRAGILASNVDWRGGARGGRGVAGLEEVTGRDGFLEFMRGWTEDFDDLTVELDQIVDVNDGRVVAIVRWRATGKGSRARVEMRTGTVYTLEAHRIVRVVPFIEPNHALKAVGLRE